MKYYPTIGLEIHIELNTASKMFCLCKNDPEEKEPNKNICPVCTAQPGVLPTANERAVRKLLKTALALNCEICNYNVFERKNYFYPDLPKGYQISQYQLPMSKDGWLLLKESKIGIERIHLEEDTGKLLHEGFDDYSLVDLNRAGVPLMELVTKPDIHSAKEAEEFVDELQLLLRYLEVSEANMEKGEMRVEVNISIAKEDDKKLGTKVEIKNLNSIRSMEKAIEYEIKRQADLLEKGEKVVQETRGWHDTKQITFSQRTKEEAHDYRYFPEPDLLPLELEEEYLREIKAEIPELPQEKRARFKREFELTDKEADLYTTQKDLGEYFEKVVSELDKKEEIKLASNYLATDLQALLKAADIKALKITPENFAELINLIYKGEISSKIAKDLLKEMFETGADPSQLIEEKGLKQIDDKDSLMKIVRETLSYNEKAVESYASGQTESLQFLIGQVMKATKGKANPKLAQDILRDFLK